MGLPVVTVAAGGLPIVESTVGGTPVTEATNGYGVPVTKVAARGMPVVFETIGVGGGGGGFATFDGTPSTAFITLSNGNLTVTKNTSAQTGAVGSTAFKSTGKYFFEMTNTVKSAGTSHSLGLAQSTAIASDVSGGAKSVVVLPAGSSWIYSNDLDQGKSLGTAASGDVYGFAIDLTARRAWIRRNAGTWNADAAANPATGTNGVIVGAGSFAPVVYLSVNAPADSVTANFGASAFVGAVPAGFTSGWPEVSGGTGGAEATAFLARTSGLDATHTNAYAALIDGLVADGVWAKLDVLHIYATQDSTTALLNLVSSSYGGSTFGSPTFTADRGYNAGVDNSTSIYISYGFIPSTAPSPKFIQNSAHISGWNVTNATSVGVMMGGGPSSPATHIHAKLTSDGKAYFRINGSNVAGVAMADPRGHCIANRSASNAIQGYKNGSSVFTSSDASSGVSSAQFIDLANNFNGTPMTGTAHQIAMTSIGASLDATQALAFYNRLRTYMTAVGVP